MDTKRVMIKLLLSADDISLDRADLFHLAFKTELALAKCLHFSEAGGESSPQQTMTWVDLLLQKTNPFLLHEAFENYQTP